jgi:hypothetical protein
MKPAYTRPYNIIKPVKRVICLRQFLDDIHNEWMNMNTDINQISKRNMMIYVHNKCEAMGLKLKYEKIANANFKQKSGLINDIKHYDFLLSGNYDIGRILISKKPSVPFMNALSFEANGLVINTNTWKMVSVLSPNMNNNPKYNALKGIFTNNVKNFTSEVKETKSDINFVIYPIIDGTTISLYWYNNKWCMSSSNSWEVNNYKWMGPESYEGIFNRLASAYQFSYDVLDKNKIYVMIMRTPEFHPFNPTNELYLVETIHKVTCYRNTDTIGIPMQQALNLNDRPNAGVELLNDIYDTNKNAVKRYLKSIENGDKYIRLGYIIKCPYDIGGSHSYVIMESDLMKNIKNYLYEFKEYELLNANNRLKYIILRAFLNYSKRDLFKKLFPQFNGEFGKLERLFNNVTRMLISNFRKKNKQVEETDNLIVDEKSDYKAPVINELVNIFMEKLSQESINIYDYKSVSIIDDYTIDLSNLSQIFKVLN